MHTFIARINEDTVLKIRYVDILPLLREENLLIFDTPIKCDEVLDTLNSLPKQIVIYFIRARLQNLTNIEEGEQLYLYTNNCYDSVHAYEKEISQQKSYLTPIEYDEVGLPLNLNKLSGERLEIELAKTG